MTPAAALGRVRTLSGWRQVTLLVGVVLLAAAAIVAVTAIGRSAPTPPSPAAVGGGAGATAGSGTSGGHAHAPSSFRCRAVAAGGVGRVPARVCIPAIGVDTDVLTLGLNPDRTVQVPPLSRVREAGWYRYSAMPGATGPMVILGHVDSATYGDGVFFRLARLAAGDLVVVTRADGVVVRYRITSLKQTSKTSFPTQQVYGQTSRPTIRLVTCGGRFDSRKRSYTDNIIAFGTLR